MQAKGIISGKPKNLKKVLQLCVQLNNACLASVPQEITDMHVYSVGASLVSYAFSEALTWFTVVYVLITYI